MGDESQTRRNVQEKSCRNRVEELKKNKFVSPSARQKWGEGEAEVRRFLRVFETFFHVFFLSFSHSVSFFSVNVIFILRAFLLSSALQGSKADFLSRNFEEIGRNHFS